MQSTECTGFLTVFPMLILHIPLTKERNWRTGWVVYTKTNILPFIIKIPCKNT